MVDEERRLGGKSDQTRGPETAKFRDPYVIVLVLGTMPLNEDNDGQCYQQPEHISVR